jgi:hypothetical protein
MKGRKEEDDKPDTGYLVDLYPALQEVLKVLSYGAKKYSRSNWRKVSAVKYRKAVIRHALTRGKDEETRLDHLAHAAADALLALQVKLDTRTTKKGSAK